MLATPLRVSFACGCIHLQWHTDLWAWLVNQIIELSHTNKERKQGKTLNSEQG